MFLESLVLEKEPGLNRVFGGLQLLDLQRPISPLGVERKVRGPGNRQGWRYARTVRCSNSYRLRKGFNSAPSHRFYDRLPQVQAAKQVPRKAGKWRLERQGVISSRWRRECIFASTSDSITPR